MLSRSLRISLGFDGVSKRDDEGEEEGRPGRERLIQHAPKRERDEKIALVAKEQLKAVVGWGGVRGKSEQREGTSSQGAEVVEAL